MKIAKRLSVKNLEYGEKQVRQMLKDRPGMGKYVNNREIIWKWAVRKFAGEDLGEVFDWNPNLPQQGYNYDHYGPWERKKGFIRIRDDFENLWVAAVYELFNIANTDKFKKVYEEACAGHLTKEQWITKNTKIEYGAVKKTKEFYGRVWEPWAKKKGFKTNPQIWYMWTPNSYSKWIKTYKNKLGYPWNSWGRYYDESMVPYLRKLAIWKTKNKGVVRITPKLTPP
jgi:hypothetical protein